tara:strand:- start:15126 stop:15851 length:726 start_codon:yes stop_codon:yes gene_type:complete
MKYILLFLLSFSAYAFDHEHKVWNQFLMAKTKMKGKQVLVDYQSIKMDPSLLKKYLEQLEGVTKSEFQEFNEKQKLSYWINAYNAYTVKLIVDNYPVKSIKDLGGFLSSPWSKEFIKLMGQEMSLDDIEHKTIRKNFKEARIHFVVNCASMGCPSLYREAIVADKIEEQLEAATKHFLTNSAKNQISKKHAKLSKIFDWYEGDFEKYHGSVRKFIQKYTSEKVDKDTRVSYLDYDWSLNKF